MTHFLQDLEGLIPSVLIGLVVGYLCNQGVKNVTGGVMLTEDKDGLQTIQGCNLSDTLKKLTLNVSAMATFQSELSTPSQRRFHHYITESKKLLRDIGSPE